MSEYSELADKQDAISRLYRAIDEINQAAQEISLAGGSVEYQIMPWVVIEDGQEIRSRPEIEVEVKL